MRDIIIAFLVCLSFCLAIWQGGKATDFNYIYTGCATDYECEQMELIEQQMENYYEREKTY